MCLLAAIIVGAVVSLGGSLTRDEPWRIDYPGITWVPPGRDSHTPEGKRYLQANVCFHQEVVSAHDLKLFLAELLRQTEDVYDYYHIRALNSKKVHVLDGVADKTGLHSISITKRYPDQ